MHRRAALRGSGGSAWWRGEVGACTESLGSDSGDVGGGDVDEQVLPAPEADGDCADGGVREEVPVPPPPEEEEEEEEEGKRRRRGGGLLLPPVMPRASEALVMRAERSGGRLILTQVRAAERQRRGVFRASRDGGRLQLCFFATNNASTNAAALNDGGGEPDKQQQQAAEAGAGGAVVVAAPHGGEPCQVAAAGGARSRVEVGAVVGI